MPLRPACTHLLALAARVLTPSQPACLRTPACRLWSLTRAARRLATAERMRMLATTTHRWLWSTCRLAAGAAPLCAGVGAACGTACSGLQRDWYQQQHDRTAQLATQDFCNSLCDLGPQSPLRARCPPRWHIMSCRADRGGCIPWRCSSAAGAGSHERGGGLGCAGWVPGG